VRRTRNRMTLPYIRSRPHGAGPLMASAALIIMLTSIFTLPDASAQDDTDTVTNPVPALDVPADPSELKPSPTPTLPPEPTSTPPPEPTLEPTLEPTPELTEVIAPTAEPTMPASEPVATPTATLPSETSSLSVQSVVAGNQCSLNGTDAVGFAQGHYPFAVFDCSAAKDHGRVTLSLSAPTAGWRYQIIESRTEPTLWRTTSFEKDLTNLGAYQIYLGPVDATVRGCGQLTVTVSAPNGTTGSATLEARTPDVGTGPCLVPAPIRPVTASLAGGTLPPIPFSFEERVVSGNLEVWVDNPSHTTGWTLDISATELIYTGPAPGQANLPASNLRVVRPGIDVVPLSTTTQRIISTGGGESSYTYPMELVIPGGAATGTYGGTVTLEITAAPGSE